MRKWLVLCLSLSLVSPSFAQVKEADVKKTAQAEKSKKAASKPAPKDKKKRGSMELKTSITFKPDNMILEVAPGKTINEKIVVKNNEAIDFQAQILVLPVFANDSSNIVRESVAKDKKGKMRKEYKSLPFLKEFIVQEKVFTVKAKQITVIPIAFKVPEDAQGAYYFHYSVQPLSSEQAKIFKSRNKDKSLTGAALNISLEVYSLGAITVKGKSEVKVAAQNQLSYLAPTKQIMLQSKLTNSGTDFAREYKGSAVVTKEGKVVAKFDVKSVQKISMLLPERSQVFAGSVGAQLTKGNYDVIITFTDHKGKKVNTFKETLKVN